MKVDTGTSALLCSIEEGVATITLNRPDARNALGEELTPALRRMIAMAGDDPEVGALLITGSGTAFCAGGDVKAMNNAADAPPRTVEEKIANLQERQRTLPIVICHCRQEPDQNMTKPCNL